MRKRLFILAALVAASTTLSAQTTPAWPPSPDHLTMPLWPNGAPGAQPSAGPEGDMTTAKDGSPGRQTGHPYRQCFQSHANALHAQRNNTGAAVVVFPGGGYRILAIDIEGTEVCDWLNSAGISCILVKYRVPEPGPYPKSSAPLTRCSARPRHRALSRSRVAH